MRYKWVRDDYDMKKENLYAFDGRVRAFPILATSERHGGEPAPVTRDYVEPKAVTTIAVNRDTGEAMAVRAESVPDVVFDIVVINVDRDGKTTAEIKRAKQGRKEDKEARDAKPDQQ